MDTSCPADAPPAEKDSSSSSLVLPSVAERSLVEAVHALVLQIARNNDLLAMWLSQMTQSMQALTEVMEHNAALLAEVIEEDEEDDVGTYLDGSPR